jgi:hypothetical protein
MKATTHPGWTVQRGQGATSVTCCHSEMARSNGPETSTLSKKDAKGWVTLRFVYISGSASAADEVCQNAVLPLGVPLPVGPS